VISTWSGLGIVLLVIGILLILFTVYETVGWILLVLGIVGIVFGLTAFGNTRRGPRV
jgi:uncharacterized membrane protein